MSTQHITTYYGEETCDFCGECSAELKSSGGSGWGAECYFCHNCFFGTHRHIVLPVNVIIKKFEHKCNDCDESSNYKLENESQLYYYCETHVCPSAPSISIVK
jgi:hypothetical protein